MRPGGRSGYSYEPSFDDEASPEDLCIDYEKLQELADPQSAPLLEGATVDDRDDLAAHRRPCNTARPIGAAATATTVMSMSPQTTPTLRVAISLALDTRAPLDAESAERFWRYAASDPELRAKIAAHPNLPSSLRPTVAADSTAKVRAAYLTRPDMSTEEFFALLEGEHRSSLIALAAASATTPPEVLERLGESSSAAVAKALLENEAAPITARRAALFTLFNSSLKVNSEKARSFVLHDRDGWSEYVPAAPAAVLDLIVEYSERSREELAAIIERLPELAEDGYWAWSLCEHMLKEQIVDAELQTRMANALLKIGSHKLGVSSAELHKLTTSEAQLGAARERARTSCDPAELSALLTTQDMYVARAVSLNRAADVETTLAATQIARNAAAVLRHRCDNAPLALALIATFTSAIHRAPIGAPREVLAALVANNEVVAHYNGPLEDLAKAGLLDASLIAELDVAAAFSLMQDADRWSLGAVVVDWLLEQLVPVDPQLVDRLLENYEGPLGRFVDICRTLSNL